MLVEYTALVYTHTYIYTDIYKYIYIYDEYHRQKRTKKQPTSVQWTVTAQHQKEWTAEKCIYIIHIKCITISIGSHSLKTEFSIIMFTSLSISIISKESFSWLVLHPYNSDNSKTFFVCLFLQYTRLLSKVTLGNMFRNRLW